MIYVPCSSLAPSRIAWEEPSGTLQDAILVPSAAEVRESVDFAGASALNLTVMPPKDTLADSIPKLFSSEILCVARSPFSVSAATAYW